MGIVVGLGRPEFEAKKIKPITLVLSEIEPMNSQWLQLTRFAAEYYQHSWGEVALPALPRAWRSVPGPRYLQSLARLREHAPPRWAEQDVPHVRHTAQQSAAIDALAHAAGFARLCVLPDV